MSVLEIDQPTTRDPLVSCGQRHTSSFHPRLLLRVTDPIDDSHVRLEVRVSLCPAEEPDLSRAALVIVSGDLGAFETAQMHDAVRAYARFAGSIVVDLSRVRSIDSAGVRFLDWLRVAQRRRDRGFAIHDPSIITERVLQICDMHERVALCRPWPPQARESEPLWLG
jgi:anti-anti-sigma factor